KDGPAIAYRLAQAKGSWGRPRPGGEWPPPGPRSRAHLQDRAPAGVAREPAARVCRRLQPIENLIGPEALQPVQGLFEGRKLIGIDAADLLPRTHMLLIERIDDIAHLVALLGELDTHGPPVNA